jgi:hypothetical protein
MMHRASLVVALSLSSCGLERDWERWQQVAQSGTEDASSSSTSTAAPDDSSSSSAADPASADSSSGSAGASDDAATTMVDDTTSTAETSTSTTSDAQPFCGDGHVDLDLQEECDDGQVVSDACVLCQRPRIIFLTSTLLKGGKIGGLISADAYCKSLALKAQQEVPDSPIVDPTNFKALLSTSTESIFDRHFIGKGPYRLVNGLTVANSFADLFNGTPLENPINVNERSETMHTFVWTGTAVDGAPYPGITFCGDWNEVTGTANFGDSDSVDAGWIHFDIALNPDSDCYGNRPIYCAEQE